MVKHGSGAESPHEPAPREGGVAVTYEASGDAYRWALATGLFEVWMDTEVLRRLSSDLDGMGRLRGSQEELGGLLFGSGTATAAGSVLRVHAVETYCSTGLHQVIGIQKDRASTPADGQVDNVGKDAPKPVGYYWIASESHSGLSQRDTTLMGSRFRDPQSICIAIQSKENGDTGATFFYWRDQRLESMRAEFPALLDACVPNVQRPREPIARHLAAPATRGSLAGYGKAALVSVAIGVLAFASWEFNQSHARNPKIEVATRPQSKSFGLKAAQRQGAVLLSWNAQSGDIANAAEGLLSVTDGQLQTNTRLPAAQLAEGSYWYFPMSGHIRFDLDILCVGGRWIRESAALNVNSDQPPPAVRLAGPATPRLPEQPSVHPRLPSKEFAAPATLPTHEPAAPVAALSAAAPVKADHTESPESAKLPVREPPAQAPEPKPVAAPALPEAPSTAPPAGSVREAAIPEAAPAAAAIPLTPPIPVEQPRPIVPPNLERMLTRPTLIRVTLRIDETGKVISAQAAGGEGPVASSLASIAVATVRLWRFKPARQGDRPVPAAVQVQFKFGVIK